MTGQVMELGRSAALVPRQALTCNAATRRAVKSASWGGREPAGTMAIVTYEGADGDGGNGAPPAAVERFSSPRCGTR